jgi:hypothetical protein
MVQAMKFAGLSEEEMQASSSSSKVAVASAAQHKREEAGGGLMGLFSRGPRQHQAAPAAAAPAQPAAPQLTQQQVSALLAALQTQAAATAAAEAAAANRASVASVGAGAGAVDAAIASAPPEVLAKLQQAAAGPAAAAATVEAEQAAADPLAITHKAEMEVTVGGKPAGTVVFGLFGNAVPKTVQNVSALAASARRRLLLPRHAMHPPTHQPHPPTHCRGAAAVCAVRRRARHHAPQRHQRHQQHQPHTWAQFVSICKGKDGLSYVGSPFHRVIKDFSEWRCGPHLCLTRVSRPVQAHVCACVQGCRARAPAPLTATLLAALRRRTHPATPCPLTARSDPGRGHHGG